MVGFGFDKIDRVFRYFFRKLWFNFKAKNFTNATRIVLPSQAIMYFCLLLTTLNIRVLHEMTLKTKKIIISLLLQNRLLNKYYSNYNYTEDDATEYVSHPINTYVLLKRTSLVRKSSFFLSLFLSVSLSLYLSLSLSLSNFFFLYLKVSELLLKFSLRNGRRWRKFYSTKKPRKSWKNCWKQWSRFQDR